MAPRAGGLRLFHRGNSGEGNLTIDLDVDPDQPRDAAVAGVQRWNLGTLAGATGEVPLTFTDAFLDDRGTQWFLAAAEDTPNAIDDGPVAGTVIGQLHDDGGWWSVITAADGTPARIKAEGLVVEPGGATAWIVTDPDDEHLTAELYRVELSGS